MAARTWPPLARTAHKEDWLDKSGVRMAAVIRNKRQAKGLALFRSFGR
jgi:hypothetical protein